MYRASKARRESEILIWSDLCEVARKLGFEVREESLPDEAHIRAGLVRLGDRRLLLVERGLSRFQKNRLLIDILRGCDVAGVFMPPYLRGLLDPRED